MSANLRSASSLQIFITSVGFLVSYDNWIALLKSLKIKHACNTVPVAQNFMLPLFAQEYKKLKKYEAS